MVERRSFPFGKAYILRGENVSFRGLDLGGNWFSKGIS